MTNTLTLIVAVLPLAILPIIPDWSPTVALMIVPLVAYLSIFLSELPSIELSPKRIVERSASPRVVQRFTQQFLARTVETDIPPPELADLQSNQHRLPPPTHEMGWRPTPDAPSDDPFAMLTNLAMIAIRENDVPTFEHVVERVINATVQLQEELRKQRQAGAQGDHTTVRGHALNTLRRISSLSVQGDGNTAFPSRFLNKVALYLQRSDVGTLQEAEFALDLLQVMADVAEPLLRKGSSSLAVVPLIAARRVGVQGVKQVAASGKRDVFFLSYIENTVPIIQSLGETSIDINNPNYLYRCLDALCWLGVYAAMEDQQPVGNACANAVVQLGRLARVKKLPCFWSRCALSPVDHARERLEWIISWTTNFGEAERARWRRSMAEALSRLEGTVTTITEVQQDGEVKFAIQVSQKPHRVHILDQGRQKVIDYSDPNETKEFRLY